jgi:isopenicillin-N N-acyltransferase like protein
LKHFHLHILWRLLASEGAKMVDQFPEDYKRELEAAGRAAGIDRERLVVGNTMFDLMKYFACSALLVDADHSATGGPLFGRNLDYPSLGYVHEYSLITVYRPDGAKHAFASVGFPGLIGCLSGMNDAGLTVAVLEVGQLRVGHRRFDITGTPYAICYRRILEECSTIAEARDLLEQMKRVSFTNLAIADPHGIAVFEATPQCVMLRRPRQGRCVCTNHYCSELLKPLVQLNFLKTLDRYQTLEQTAAQQERLTVEEMHHGLYKAKQTIDTVQTMIFEPATLRAHMGIGTCPSTVGDLKVLELAPLLHVQ